MLKFEHIETMNWRAAIRGMRNPFESHHKSDSHECKRDGSFCFDCHDLSGYCIGPEDLKLAKRLANAGTDHSKFLRMITVSFDMVAPLYFWKEFDTYKIGTVRNSCSTMHKIEAGRLTIDNFATDIMTIADLAIMEAVIIHINNLITLYKNTIDNNEKRTLHKRIVKLLPDSYLQKATITTNYQVLRAIRNSDRKTHKLDEWREDFMKFIDSLPYAKELLKEEYGEENERDEEVPVKNDECHGCICYNTFNDLDYSRCSKLVHQFDEFTNDHKFHCTEKNKTISVDRLDFEIRGKKLIPDDFNDVKGDKEEK